MKALQLAAVNDLRLVDLPVPAPRDDQLLVKTGAATICTSDLYDIRANPFGIPLPVVLGHEGAGTIVGLGSAVRGFAVGDRIAAHSVWPCGECDPCREGLSHMCARMEHFGLNVPGVFAEYFAVRADRARKVPDAVPFTAAALAEPVCCSLEALAQARLSVGQSLLILGDGPFGMLMARLSSAMGLSRVVVAGHQDFRLSFAGSAQAVNTSRSDDPAALLRDSNRGKGYDAVILATDNRAAVQQGMDCLKPKGRLVVFASFHGDTPVDLFRVQLKEFEIVGAVNDQDRFDAAVGALSNPRLGLGDLVTHTYPLEEYRQAFEMAERGLSQALKVALIPVEGLALATAASYARYQ